MDSYLFTSIAFLEGMLNITVIIIGNGINDLNLNLGQNCVSLWANSFGKSINPSFLLLFGFSSLGKSNRSKRRKILNSNQQYSA